MASFGSPVLPKIGITIGLGATMFTRMPRPASSAAAVRPKERSAALVAEYALAPTLLWLSEAEQTVAFPQNVTSSFREPMSPIDDAHLASRN